MTRKIIVWFVFALLIGGVVSLFASSHPDGFEKAGEEVGYMANATSHMQSPLPDYSFPGSDSWLSASASGLIGVMITFGIFFLLGKLITRRNQ